MGFRSRRKEADSKYLRLTGLWQNKKKDNLFTGKMRAEDVEKLVEKAGEAVDAGVDLVFFLWENEKDSQKDPDFTLQCVVAEEEVGGFRTKSKRSTHSGRDREESRDEDRDRKRSSRRDEEDAPEEATEEAQDEPEEREEKPRSRSRKPEPAPALARKSKKDQDDW